MNKSDENTNFSDNIEISILDWKGVIKNGVGVVLKMKVLDTLTFDFFYWFNKEGYYKLLADDRFLNMMNINNMHEYKYINDLKRYIDLKILPKREKIWKEFDL